MTILQVLDRGREPLINLLHYVVRHFRLFAYLILEEVTRLVFKLELRLEHGGFAMELLVVFNRDRFFFEFNSLLLS